MENNTAYDRYNKVKYDLSKEELSKLFGPGEIDKREPWELVLEDWAPIVELATGERTGFATRVKGRPVMEIYRKLEALVHSAGLIVDEYFTISPDAEYTHNLVEWPDNVVCIMCYAIEGGSEGHYVHVDVQVRNGRDTETIGVFLIKTFLGMGHVLRLSNTLTRIFHK